MGCVWNAEYKMTKCCHFYDICVFIDGQSTVKKLLAGISHSVKYNTIRKQTFLLATLATSYGVFLVDPSPGKALHKYKDIKETPHNTAKW